jgi:hypothetical protein
VDDLLKGRGRPIEYAPGRKRGRERKSESESESKSEGEKESIAAGTPDD